MDCSLPGFSVHGILQARILNWVPIFFSRGSSQPRNWTQVYWLRADSLPTELQGKPYCSYSIGLCFHHKAHPNWASFLLWHSLFILSGAISLLFPSNIFNTYWSWWLIFQFPILLLFHTVHGVLKARMLKWFAVPFPSEPCFVRTLHHELSSWWPCTVWLIVSLNIPRHFSLVIRWCPFHTIFPLSLFDMEHC